MDDTFKARIDGIIQSQLGVDADRIVEDATLIGDLEADSLDAVELVMRLEEEFRVEISDAQCEALATVKDVHRLVEELLQPA